MHMEGEMLVQPTKQAPKQAPLYGLDNNVLMKFVGNPVRILCEMNPQHKKFVVGGNRRV